MGASPSWAEQIKSFAMEAGFDLCGIAPAPPPDSPDPAYFSEWIAAGMAGEMEYLKARNEAGEFKRAALQNAWPWARSVIVCAVNYNSSAPYSIEQLHRAEGWIARYAWFANRETGKASDYHDAVLARLRQVEARIQRECERLQQPVKTRCYVDTGPMVERVYAKIAGIGWLGKNTCLINQELGSWLFLGVIITSVDFAGEGSPVALPAADRCGSCSRCIDACPTHALTPYKMDARRCIAYLTIEKRGAIPEELRDGIGRNVFGCDICQDVCPWNGAENSARRPPATTLPEFHTRAELVNPALDWLASLNRDEFNRLFRGSPVKRARYAGMRRNVAVAMGNSGCREFIPQLEAMAGMEGTDEDANAASHALWALRKLSRGEE